MRFALAALASMIASRAVAAERPPAALYQRWLHANEDCRGGSGDSAETNTACEYRNTIDRKMAAAGWCYGRPGESGYQMDWHRCGR